VAYYISSRKLTAEQLLHHARMEWSVESMHWLLDVHFEEDWCLVEDKAAINLIKLFKERSKTKRAISNIMLDCLIDPHSILRVVGEN
jgi:predicted transposase YbfD/YdcC